MRFNRISLVGVLAIVSLASSAEEEAPKAEAGPVEPKEQREYVEKHSQMNVLATKIEDEDKKFNELVEEKERAVGSEAKQEVIREMVKTTNERKKDVEQYRTLKNELTLRYPSEGEPLSRHYQTEAPARLDHNENAAGLDEMLTRTKKIIDRKFAPFMADEAKPNSARKPSSVEEGPRLRLEK